MMLGRKREAERTRLLAKRFEMPPALSTTNLRCSPRQLRKQGARWGGRRAGTVTQQQERPDRQTDGRTDKPSARRVFSRGAAWLGREGEGQHGCLPGDPHPHGGLWGKAAGGGGRCGSA